MVYQEWYWNIAEQEIKAEKRIIPICPHCKEALE